MVAFCDQALNKGISSLNMVISEVQCFQAVAELRVFVSTIFMVYC